MSRPIAAILLAFVFVVTGLSSARAATGLSSALDQTFVLISADLDRTFLGSAFVYGPRGVVVTNAHVVDDAASVVARTRSGAERTLKVLARDTVRDIAILEWFAPGGLTPAPAAPGIGAEVYAIGAPLDHGHSVSRGIISADPRQLVANVPLRFVQHDAAINPGSSGGPLVDATGALLGMNTRIADGSRFFVGLSFAISSADLARYIDAMLGPGLPPMPELGAHLRSLDARLAAALGLPLGGILVDHVAPFGAAGEAGLAPGDLITGVNDHGLDRLGDLAFALEAAQGASTTAKLHVLRGGLPLTLTVSLKSPQPREAAPPPPAPPLGITLGPGNEISVITRDGLGLRSGLAHGDRITHVNGARADTPIDPASWPPLTALLIARDGRSLHLVIDRTPTATTRRNVLSGNVLDLAVVPF